MIEETYSVVRPESKRKTIVCSGSYLGIAIDLVCATLSTAASSVTCWEIELRINKIITDYQPAVL